MNNESETLQAVLDGTIRIRRFNVQEQSGSANPADRFLWLGILRAESELASIEGGGLCGGTPTASGGTPSPYRFLTGLAQPLPKSFEELIGQLGRYEDRGQESLVCDAGNGFVNKLRPMRPSILSGYIAPLANIIYHNRIFPRERYTLENIFVQNARYFMVLRQERVEIALDSRGYPVKPTANMIRDAISELGIGLIECRKEEESDSDSSESDSDSTAGERLRFYNSDYYISDLQPGRNTVIDSATGRVRFIDPRITLNDPAGPITPVSKFGKRKESHKGQKLLCLPPQIV